ncbi:MAG: glucose-1-phosphate thymidylyltransferase [Candidatus Omnitrophota bacterium]|jgi:glucose-1-phosphate thymidylyltransferase|nr:MAG: glucose-1-phosphate thymidylyltransferase [Candidatus Omnitrophota bacterium]
MKGIILAGGKATRLYPITRAVCKQLLPVYDKPMVYYPLSLLMLAGIKDILLISTPEALPRFKDLLGNGSEIGIKIRFAEQRTPRGIAQALTIAEGFIGKDKVCLVLGDNVFFGQGLSSLLKEAVRQKEGATIFGYYVNDPARYGVIGFDRKGGVSSIEEKPKRPKSNYVITGIYFYDHLACSIAKALKPSQRKEFEITDVNRYYLERGKLKVKLLGRGYAWLDMGTYESLMEASEFIKTMEQRQGVKVGCIEEVAYKKRYIDERQLRKLAKEIPTSYGDYLRRLLKNE